MKKSKLSPLERNWVLYDVGNSAFTLLVSTLLPIYFNYIAGNAGISSVDYLAYWGYAASIVTIIVAFMGPVVGTMTDIKDFRKPIFMASIAIGTIGCIAMGFAKQWILFLAIYMIAKIGYSCSLIFYDSMLSDVTTNSRMDMVSAQGFAWGYIGSCVPFAGCLVIVLFADKIGISLETAMLISFIIIAVWWGFMSIPLIKTYKQKHYILKSRNAVSDSFSRIGKTFANIKKQKKIMFFIIAFFFYIDGVYTIIDMATAYGSALGLNSITLLLALLVTQIIAFPCAIIFGRLSEKIETSKLILVCIVAYFGIAVFAVFLRNQIQFWILAMLVGMFQGGIQALSRSFFTKIIPQNQSGEYFGILDICGKGASFVGTTVVGAASQITGNINIGVGMISIMFILGIVFFGICVRTPIDDIATDEKKDCGQTQIKTNDKVVERLNTI